MHRFACLALWAALAIGSFPLACWADEAAAPVDEVVADMQPVMVPVEDETPSDEEWDALHKDTQRAGLFGSLGDLKSPTISFMNTQYFTNNRAEGTLASYGKLDAKKGFDRFGHIDNVEFDVPTNSWKQRYVLNAAALLKLTGKARFQEVAGVELDTAVSDRRQIEVTFVGTMVPKDEAVRRLNADVDALDYLLAVQTKRMQYKKSKFNLFGSSTPPPEPKVVLANVVMLDGKASKAFDRGADGTAQTIIHGIGGGLKVSRQGSEDVSLLTPVVRCYRTYSIEFKTDADGNLALEPRPDRHGRTRNVPVVFDLTPDL